MWGKKGIVANIELKRQVETHVIAMIWVRHTLHRNVILTHGEIWAVNQVVSNQRRGEVIHPGLFSDISAIFGEESWLGDENFAGFTPQISWSNPISLWIFMEKTRYATRTPFSAMAVWVWERVSANMWSSPGVMVRHEGSPAWMFGWAGLDFANPSIHHLFFGGIVFSIRWHRGINTAYQHGNRPMFGHPPSLQPQWNPLELLGLAA